MPIDTDVVVVGGGPGGSACAIACARVGLSVVLVESCAGPRDRPGETLAPGIEPLLDQLGVLERVNAANFLRPTGIWVHWGEERRFQAFGEDARGPWLGYQAWRADFDTLLLEEARVAGVTVHQPCRVGAPLQEDGRVVGLSTNRGPIRARYVVDAAGGRHWLARHLGLEVTRRSPRLFARYGYVTGEPEELREVPRLCAHKTGWTWSARVRPNLYAWTRLEIDEGCAEGDRLDVPPPELQGLPAMGPTRRVDVTWRLVSDCAGPGYFLVGDAACVLDPASSHGVLKAVMTGLMAAHCMQRIQCDSFPASQALAEYRTWLAEWFAHDLRALNELYAVFPSWRSLDTIRDLRGR